MKAVSLGFVRGRNQWSRWFVVEILPQTGRLDRPQSTDPVAPTSHKSPASLNLWMTD